MGASAVPGVRRSARLMQELPVAKRERPVAKGERPVAKRKKRMEVPDTKREKAKAFATAAHASTAREASARADGVELIVGYATTPVPQTLRIASIATLPAALAPDRATPRPQPAGATRRGGALLPGRSSPRPAPFRREPNRFRASATRRASPTRFRAPSSGNISRLGRSAGSRELRWQLSCSGRGGASPTLTPAFLSLTREALYEPKCSSCHFPIFGCSRPLLDLTMIPRRTVPLMTVHATRQGYESLAGSTGMRERDDMYSVW